MKSQYQLTNSPYWSSYGTSKEYVCKYQEGIVSFFFDYQWVGDWFWSLLGLQSLVPSVQKWFCPFRLILKRTPKQQEILLRNSEAGKNLRKSKILSITTQSRFFISLLVHNVYQAISSLLVLNFFQATCSSKNVVSKSLIISQLKLILLLIFENLVFTQVSHKADWRILIAFIFFFNN